MPVVATVLLTVLGGLLLGLGIAFGADCEAVDLSGLSFAGAGSDNVWRYEPNGDEPCEWSWECPDVDDSADGTDAVDWGNGDDGTDGWDDGTDGWDDGTDGWDADAEVPDVVEGADAVEEDATSGDADSDDAAGAPVITAPARVDFGRLRPGQVGEAEFWITNGSPEPQPIVLTVPAGVDLVAPEDNAQSYLVPPGEALYVAVHVPRPVAAEPAWVTFPFGVAWTGYQSLTVSIEGAFWSGTSCVPTLADVALPQVVGGARAPVGATLGNAGDGPCGAARARVMVGEVTLGQATPGQATPGATCELSAEPLGLGMTAYGPLSLEPGATAPLEAELSAPPSDVTASIPARLVVELQDPGAPVADGPSWIAAPQGACDGVIGIAPRPAYAAASTACAGCPADAVVAPSGPEGCPRDIAVRVGGLGRACPPAACEGAVVAGPAGCVDVTPGALAEWSVEPPSGAVCDVGVALGAASCAAVASCDPAVDPDCAQAPCEGPDCTASLGCDTVIPLSVGVGAPLGEDAFVLGDERGVLLIAASPDAAAALRPVLGQLVAPLLGPKQRIGVVGVDALPLTLDDTPRLLPLDEAWLDTVRERLQALAGRPAGPTLGVDARLTALVGTAAFARPAPLPPPPLGCTSDADCAPPMVCHTLAQGSACMGQGLEWFDAPGGVLHVVWAGPVDGLGDPEALLDALQAAGVLRHHALVVHHLATVCVDTPGGLEPLVAATGGTAVSLCDADAVELLAAALAAPGRPFRLRASPASDVELPPLPAGCPETPWISASGRTLRLAKDVGCEGPAGAAWTFHYTPACATTPGADGDAAGPEDVGAPAAAADP